MVFATITEIDVYGPSNANGIYASGDPISRYTGTGTKISSNFTLDLRNQIPPTETSLGVRILWSYAPPGATGVFAISTADYAVFKAAPIEH
jgi:hypothetical protein